MAKGTQIPAATLDEVYAWYQFRHVCDNDRFGVYFGRQLRLAERQYLLLLRNDMTTWDPMVSDYMERQIKADESGTSSMTSTGTVTGTKSGTQTHDTSGKDVTDITGETGNTRTLNTETASSGQSSAGGSDKVTSESTRTDDLAHTRSDTSTRTDDTESQSNSSTMSNDIADAVSLSGSTPDSSTYGTGSTIGLMPPESTMPEVSHSIGAPAQLDWKYTSAQGENVTKSDSVTRNAGTTTNTGTVTTEGSGKTTDTGTVSTDGSQTTEYGRTTHDSESVENTGTISDAGTSSGKSTITYGKSLLDTTEAKENQTTETEQSGTSGKQLDHKERYSGRHESPTELLRKAQSYIEGSNSLRWLLAQLEPCFYQIWEAW